MLVTDRISTHSECADDLNVNGQLNSDRVKKELAQSFSKAAKHYNQKAEVQQRIADQLLNLLTINAVENRGANWLDLGCGSGYLLNQMSQQQSTWSNSSSVPSSTFLGIDIAHGMLIEANKKNSGHLINADAESIPLRSGSIDHVVSSMALQWVSSPTTVMQEIARVLRKDGLVTLAILRDDSLPELHQGWQSLGQAPRANRFAARPTWQQAAQRAGLSIIDVEQTDFQTQHANIIDLLYSIKGIGAGTTLKNTAPPLRRSHLRALEQWWRANYQLNTSLTLTYTVDFWQLKR